MSNEIRFDIEYRTQLFKTGTMERLAKHFLNLIYQVCENPDIKLSNVDILAEEEKQLLIFDYNQTEAEYPRDKTIHELFAEQVERVPDNIAAAGPLKIKHRPYMTYMTYISYRELNQKSDQLAHLLKEKGVLTDNIVGIMVERSVEMIIGIFSILKAGGAYLPIDPEYPENRIRYILSDSGTKILLTRQEIEGLIPPSTLLPFYPSNSSNLAYIIYTSGTTGKPKGVMVRHGSLVNLCYWHNSYYQVTKFDHATLYASVSFDASVWELFPYLIKGALLHIIPDSIKTDIRKLYDYFEKHHITISFLPTQLCELFISKQKDNQSLSLRVLLTGGDKLHNFVKRSYALYNNYGPTENTVVTTACLVEKHWDNIPIGKPVANTNVYILDKENTRLKPVGVAGELCISGVGIARGYLNNPEKTNSKFQITNYKQITKYRSYRSYRSNISRIKIYRTGDLARWLWDANIEFLGRLDSQVKIRGFRIELGEIENRLLMHEKIKEAVVLPIPETTGDKYLCAYIVGRDIDSKELKRYLSQSLPGYMVPTYFVMLDRLPLTARGKIDKTALPDPPWETGREEYAAPRDEIEKKLLEIWYEILGIDPLKVSRSIGINDNFFDLGGHSLKATALVSTIHEKLNIKIPLVEIFKTPTIRSIASVISAADWVKNQKTDDNLDQEQKMEELVI